MTERTLHCRNLLTPAGWRRDAILHLDEQGQIEKISSGAGKKASFSLGGHVIPGMPNLHSHAFQRQMAGWSNEHSGGEDSFWTWRQAMYDLARRITPGQMQSVAAWLQLEMLEAGYTSCAEFHYLHHQPDGQPYSNIAELGERLLEAAEISGIALTLLPVLYCHGGFGGKPVKDHQLRFYNRPDRFLELVSACRDLLAAHPLHRLGFAPHSLRAVTAEQLDEVTGVLGDEAAAIHIHIAEQPAEVAESIEFFGLRPLAWLLEHQDVDQQWCLVHATHIDRDEREMAAACGATAGLCPTTEADLGDGFFGMEQWLDAGGSFGIGSDSNVRVCVAEELRWLENESRLRSGRRNVLARDGHSCGRYLYEHAATGGAQALGQPVGQISPGFRADLVELDRNHPMLIGRQGDEVLDTFVFAGGQPMIRSVWVAGREIVKEGAHPGKYSMKEKFRLAVEELSEHA
jgi:formimidoylglutamate deiminase